MTTRQPPAVGALFAGKLDDGGFMEFGYRGLLRAKSEFNLSTIVIDQIPPVPAQLADALRQLAQTGASLVIAHGGQNDAAACTVAAAYPNTRFAVSQGSVRGSNLSSYEVCQEHSAFLAGVAAAQLTRTGVVGHISGIRVRPGLLGRAAYAAGVAAGNPLARLLTTFCGTQDDAAVAERVAQAQIAAGADIIFTMLNAAMPGAMAASRAGGTRLIGNVRDWVASDPQLFAGSAMADVGLGVYEACRDVAQGKWHGDHIRRMGAENPAAVRLQLAPNVPAGVAQRIQEWQRRLVSGETVIAEGFAGTEFDG